MPNDKKNLEDKKDSTKIVHLGRSPEKHYGMVNTPIYKTSTVIFPKVEDYWQAEKGKAVYDIAKNLGANDLCYATTGTPTTFDLQRTLASLEGAEYCAITSSGLSAISNTLLGLLRKGDHLLVVDNCYGPTRRFCEQILKRFGVEITYYDPTIGNNISKLFQKNTKAIFTESPGSLTFEIQDIPAIADVANKADIIVITDNSWATPLHFKPLEHGAKVSVQAVTKYIAGHSDILLGSIAANGDIFKKIYKTHHSLGDTVSPDDCFLALRGIRTLPLRLKTHQENALYLTNWLSEQDCVKEIFYPELKSYAQHSLYKKLYKGAGGLFSFVIDNEKVSESQIIKMANSCKLFKIGASWGGFESLILPGNPDKIRTVNNWNNRGHLVRIFAGLEDKEDLLEDLQQAFSKLK